MNHHTITTGRHRLKAPAPHRLGHLPLSGSAPALVASLALLALSRSRVVGWLAFLLAGSFSVGGFGKPGGFAVPGGFGKTAGFAAETTDTPSHRYFDTASEPPSVANLSRALTIGALTGTPIGFYKAQDSTTNLVAEVGTTLTRSAAGTIAYAQGCPLMGSDTAIKGDGTNYFADSGTTYGNVGTLGTVWTGLIKATGTTSVLFAKRNAAVGYQCGIDASDRLYYTIQDADGAVTTVSAALVIGCWYHFAIVAIREGEGTCQIYLQRTASGAAVDISAAEKTLDSATAFTVFADSNHATPFDGSLSYLAGWTFAAGLTQAAALVAIAARFRALTGLRPQASAAGVDTAPITAARNCVATLEKYNTTTSAVEYYTVGENWLRVESWWDATLGRVVMGYRSELAAENTQQDSFDIYLFAVQFNITAATGATICGLRASTLTETAVDNVHGIWNNTTSLVSGTTYSISILVRARLRTVIAFRQAHGAGSSWCNFILTGAGSVGYSAGCASSSIRQVDSGVYRCQMQFVSSATEARAHLLHTRPSNINSEPYSAGTFLGDSTSPAIDATAFQVESGSTASSPIASAAAASTVRAKDELTQSVIGSTTGAIALDMITRASGGGATGTILATLSDNGAVNNARLVFTAAGRADARVGAADVSNGATTIANATTHGVAMRWRVNSVEIWRDGVIDGTPDASVAAITAPDRLSVGMYHDGTLQPAGPTLIRNVRVYGQYPAGMARISTVLS